MSEEVCIGLLGLGNVGGGVVRTLQEAGETLRARGLSLRIGAALVRDAHRARPEAGRVPFITDSGREFFSRSHDVVIEVLGGVNPALGFVERALDSGTPVVTANKSLLAEHGVRLAERALARGTELRFEASVVAGVPFLDTLSHRPLAGAVERLEGILNATSNYILTAMTNDEASFNEALARAQALGFAEPNPDNDVTGRDAGEKLCVLLRHLRVADLRPGDVRTLPLTAVTRDDIAHARQRGGAIKPIVRASRSATGVETFVGPAFVPGDHPLARVHGALNGVLLQSQYAGPLFYSGPGAGPAVTAATILDDVALLVESGAHRRKAAACA